jgi:hypothetical protein
VSHSDALLPDVGIVGLDQESAKHGMKFASIRCSFSTSEDTKAYLSQSHGELINEEDAELLQNKSPKVDAATLDPISWPKDPAQEW